MGGAVQGCPGRWGREHHGSHGLCRLTSSARPAGVLPGVTFHAEEPLSKALVGAKVFLGTKTLILVFDTFLK